MWMATTDDQFTLQGPATSSTPDFSGFDFSHPDEVASSPALARSRKREILAAWASDASAVQDSPSLRWLLGTPRPVPLDDIRAALRRLDDIEDDGAPAAVLREPMIIRVEPCGDGWALTCGEVANLQLFRSGRAAERAARRLGERLAAAGRWAEIHVRLRSGDMAGRFVCAPG